GHSVSKQEPWTTQFRGTVPAAVPVHPQPSTTQAKTEAEGVPPGSLIIRHSPERHEHPAPAVTVTKPLRDEPKPAADMKPQHGFSPHQFVVSAYQAHQAPIEVARQGSVPVPQAPVEVPRSFAAPAYQTPAAVSHQSTPPVHQASAEAPWHHSAPAYTPPPTH